MDKGYKMIHKHVSLLPHQSLNITFTWPSEVHCILFILTDYNFVSGYLKSELHSQYYLHAVKVKQPIIKHILNIAHFPIFFSFLNQIE
jgi:hypothetical protein